MSKEFQVLLVIIGFIVVFIVAQGLSDLIGGMR